MHRDPERTSGIGITVEPPRRSLRTASVWRFAFALAVTAASVKTQALAQSPLPFETEQPAAITAQTPVAYFPDTTFNNGRYVVDSFGGDVSSNYLGKKVVQLPNGDVVVAGIVPPFAGGANVVNLGLVRYNAAGQRVAWANPGVYGFSGNQYVIYPNTNATAGLNVVNVLDLKLYGNRLFVLVDRAFSATDIDSRVVVFDTDGRYLAVTSVFGGDNAEYSGGIVLYDNMVFPTTLTIAAAGTTYVGGVARPSFRSGTVNADGTIEFGAVVFPNPGNYCPANRGCRLTGIAAGGRTTTTSPPRLYLGGSREQDLSTANWDYLAMQVTSSGAPNSGFAGNGVTTIPFNAGGDNFDGATAIAATPGFLSADDAIYLVGLTRLPCTDGIGIVKLKQDGSRDSSFGNFGSPFPRTGMTSIGQSGVLPPQCASAIGFYGNAAALSIDDSRLGIAGFLSGQPACSSGPPCPENIVDGTLAVIDTANGDVVSNRSVSYTNPGSSARSRYTGLWGITAGVGNTFTATGDSRFFQTAPGQPSGPQQYVTIRFRPDTIFMDGFD